MSHSYSNHQRMATIPPNNLTICNIDGTPIQNAGNFLTNNNGAHSWQTEQTINLETINLDEFDNEHFNLVRGYFKFWNGLVVEIGLGLDQGLGFSCTQSSGPGIF
ncbi:unnamed protein product [Meloidogyne enterolobii]|uniref:Uncharacterized protein n=1 Tax=Meloidogyne enterolobii TaxID=390850 RepID=A0ACB0ZVU7_MELEN